MAGYTGGLPYVLNGGQIDFDRKDGNRTPQVLVEDAAKKGLWVFPLVEGNAPTLVSPRDYQVMDKGAVVTRYGDTDFPDGVLVVYPGPDKAPHSAYVGIGRSFRSWRRNRRVNI